MIIIKKTSENDQLTGHFQSFFYSFFRPFIWKKSHKSTNNNILAKKKKNIKKFCTWCMNAYINAFKWDSNGFD